MMEIQIDTQNIMKIRISSCDYGKLLADMKKVACMVVKKYHYPYSMVDDVVSESLVFLFSHVERIPVESARVNSYVLALSRSIFRGLLFGSRDRVSQAESDYRMEVVASVFRRVGDVDEFHVIVGKVFKTYCFAPLLADCVFKIVLEELEVLSNKSSFRHLFINAHNRLRFDRVENIEERFQVRNG